MVHMCFKPGLPGQGGLGRSSQRHDAQFKITFCVQELCQCSMQTPNDRGEVLREQDLGFPCQQLQCSVLMLV